MSVKPLYRRLFTVSALTGCLVVAYACPAAEPGIDDQDQQTSLAESAKTAASEAISPAHRAAEAPATQQALPAAGVNIYQNLLHSTAFIVVEEQNSAGQTLAVRRGSGWVVDRERKLVVTNHHVIGLARKAKVYFPVTEDMSLVTERNRYLSDYAPITATVFLDEPTRDLALLKLDRLPEECEAAPLAKESPSPGERLYSVGNPGASEALFVFSTGIVRQVYRRKISYADGQVVEARIIESQSPINPGDSGGPVVNGKGEVVGVVESRTQGAQLFNVLLDISEVKTLMRDAEELWAPTTAEQFFRRGMQYYDRADYEQAIQDFNEAIRLNPQYAEALARRGECYVQQGDLDTAEADLQEAVSVDGRCAEARLGLALVAIKRQDWAKAGEQATQAIRLNSSDFRSYFFRGLAHYARAEHDRALPDFERAQKLKPDAQNSLYLARTRMALKDYRRAVEDYRTATQLNPQLIAGYTDLADALTNERSYAGAITILNEGVKANPRSAVLYYKRARAYRGARQFNRAVDDLNLMASNWKNEPLVYELRGWVYEDMHEYDRAAKDFREAIRIAPNVAKYHMDLAYLDFALGRLEEADAQCDTAAAIDPKTASTHMLRAMIHFALGKPQAAVDQDVNRARAIDPQYEKAVVRRYVGKYLTFVNETDEPLEISVYFRGRSVNDEFYWYPAAPSKGKPIVLKVDGHQSIDLTYQGQRVSVVEYAFSARGMVSGATWSNVSRRISDDAGYVFWKRQVWFQRLFIKK